MQALIKDAWNRKLCSIATLHEICLWYNEKLREKDREVARLLLAGRAGASKRGAPATATSRKRQSRIPAEDGHGPQVEEEGAVVDAFANEPAKRGAGGRKPQADTAKPDSVKKRGRRLRLAVFTCMHAASLLLGGKAGLSLFIVNMIRSAVCRTGLVRRHVYLKDDVLRMLVDDPLLRKSLTRDIDARRRPRLASFQAARFSGTTYASIDRLRFAMIYAPGHSTMVNADKEWERMLKRRFCPSGPTADAWWTTRTDAEQQASADADCILEDEAGEEEDNDDADEDPAMERAAEEASRAPRDEVDLRNEQADRIRKEGLALLKDEFPDEDAAELEDRWSGGADEEGVFEGANVVHVCAVSGGQLLGFVKALVTEHEVFIDEVLVGEASRGLGYAHHLIAALVALFPSAPRLRLQVRKNNLSARGIYDRLGFKIWKAPTDQGSIFYGEKPQHAGRFMFMAADPHDVASKAAAGILRKPLAPHVSIWRQTLLPLRNANVEHVRSDPGGNGPSPVPQTVEQPPEKRRRGTQSAAPPPQSQTSAVTEDDDEPVLDDEQRQKHPPKPAKEAAKWWGCAVKDALVMILIGITRTLEPAKPHGNPHDAPAHASTLVTRASRTRSYHRAQPHHARPCHPTAWHQSEGPLGSAGQRSGSP